MRTSHDIESLSKSGCYDLRYTPVVNSFQPSESAAVYESRQRRKSHYKCVLMSGCCGLCVCPSQIWMVYLWRQCSDLHFEGLHGRFGALVRAGWRYQFGVKSYIYRANVFYTLHMKNERYGAGWLLRAFTKLIRIGPNVNEDLTRYWKP